MQDIKNRGNWHELRGFLGGSDGKESAIQVTWVRSGKIPHAKEQLSLCARTIEPVLLRSGAQEPRLLKAEFPKARALLQEKPRQGEA